MLKGMDMEIIGRKVSHNKLGIGTIVWCGGMPQNDSTYIKVEFENKIIELVFPTCFENHLTALDDDFAKFIEHKLVKMSKKEVKPESLKPLAQTHHSQQKHKPLTYCGINTFVFKKEIGYNRIKNKTGFKTFDKTGRNVGVTFMNDDKRRASYGQAEICFYDEYKEEFGEWRLISIDKVRLSFEKLSSTLLQHGSFEVTIDPRKGS